MKRSKTQAATEAMEWVRHFLNYAGHTQQCNHLYDGGPCDCDYLKLAEEARRLRQELKSNAEEVPE